MFLKFLYIYQHNEQLIFFCLKETKLTRTTVDANNFIRCVETHSDDDDEVARSLVDCAIEYCS
jgi:hypothetical protein